jgi:hypothetical protein
VWVLREWCSALAAAAAVKVEAVEEVSLKK